MARRSEGRDGPRQRPCFFRSVTSAVMIGLVTGACATVRTADPASAGEGEPLMDLGRAVFLELAEPNCALCHTLREAGATGAIGPNLDELEPEMQAILLAVTDGVGVMPSQEGHLTDRQIRAVSFYVSEVAGGQD